MNDMNQIIVEGTVEKKPDFQQTLGKAFCMMKISVKRSYKDMRGDVVTETDEFDLVSYGDMAAFCKNLDVDIKVRIIGRLKQNKWSDSAGKAYSNVNIVVEHLEKLRAK